MVKLVEGDCGVGPAVDPFGVFGFHVDAAIAHYITPVGVPKRTMERDSEQRNITDPRNAREVIDVGVGRFIDHPAARTFAVRHPAPNRSETIANSR